MPIYEYRCEGCGNELEKLQRISEDPLKDCPKCGKATLRRLISAAGFRLKGSGWYETDFKQGNRRNVIEAGSDKPAQDTSSGGREAADKPAESKPKDTAPDAAVKKEKPTATQAGQPA